MAYRKTETVLAHLDARRQGIIAAAIDVIGRSGMDGLTVNTVAVRAGMSAGLLYKYFADMNELQAVVTAQLLARDLNAMRDAALSESNPLRALARAIEVFYARLANPHLVNAMATLPGYRIAIRDELARMIRDADLYPSAKDRQMAAAASLGAIYGMIDVDGRGKAGAPMAVLFVLKGLGVSDAVARKAIACHDKN